MVPKNSASDLKISSSARHPGGRHLDASRDDALRHAALTLLAKIGYDRLTVEAIAQGAGAGKATIYRRWSGKAELVVDALSCGKLSHEAPDTGSLRGDLIALAGFVTGRERGMDAKVLIGMANALSRDAELRKVFREGLVAPRVATLTSVFARAVERGEIPPVANLDMVISIFPALVVHRVLLHGLAPSPKFAEEVIDDVILPLVGATNSHRPDRGASIPE